MSIETKRSLVMARDKFVATVGVDDLVIVSTKTRYWLQVKIVFRMHRRLFLNCKKKSI